MTDSTGGPASPAGTASLPAANAPTGEPVSSPDTPAAGPTTPVPSTEADWTDQVTDLIVDSVDKVRSRTTGPILEVSRISVHAVVALILLLPVMVLTVIGVVRLITYWVGEVWITYTILGTLFVLVGVLMWSRRRPAQQ